MADSTESDEAGSARSGGSKLPLVMAVCAAATVGAAGGMYAMLKRAPAAPAAAGAHGEGAAPEPVEEASDEEGSTVTMNPFVVNLSDDTGDPHYLKCTIAVELGAAKYEKVFEARTPKVRNAILLYLSSLRVTDTDGVVNKRKMLTELKNQVQDIVGHRAVHDMYLTEFVIQ